MMQLIYCVLSKGHEHFTKKNIYLFVKHNGLEICM